MKRVVALAVLSLGGASSALIAADPRIRLVTYRSDAVVTLAVAPGYAGLVELSPNETIDSVVVGNSGAWQVTETQSGNRVVVKPLPGAVPTNMIVMTDQRRYVFLLDPSAGGEESSFVVQFADRAVNQQRFSRAPIATYKFHGDRALFPVAMSDDGKRTTIRWADRTPLPAVFSMAGRNEAVVDGRMIGADYVVEGTSERYKLRFGSAQAIAVRRMRPAK